MPLKPATIRARRLFAALSALAERGINGEKSNAQAKLERLKARFDFSQDAVDAKDIFSGIFYKSPYSVPVLDLPELDIGAVVKWAIEARTGISCRFKGACLLAEATPATAKTLAGISGTVAGAFSQLWKTYEGNGGLRQDRNCFIAGLYDGMMDTPRAQGQPLPTRATPPRVRRKSHEAPTLAAHPYTLALGYGRKIRFSVPIQTVDNELRDNLQKQIGEA